MQGTDAGSGLGCHGKAPRLLWVCSGIDLLTRRTAVLCQRRMLGRWEGTPTNDTRDVELNAIGVLKRREIEARILAPAVEALSREFGRERVLQIMGETIVGIARDQGGQLVQISGGNSLQQFAAVLPSWTKEDPLEIEVLVQSEDKLRFNVTRCRYAEMYEALGLSELGAILSCGRDAALIEGFNSNFSFERLQAILGGASHCDFRYGRRKHVSSGDQKS